MKNKKVSTAKMTKQFVRRACVYLDGQLRVSPDISEREDEYKYEIQSASGEKKTGTIVFAKKNQAVPEKNTEKKGKIFDYVFGSIKREEKSDNYVTPKSEFGGLLLNRIFDTFSVLTHIVSGKKGKSCEAKLPMPPEGTLIKSNDESGNSESEEQNDVNIEVHLLWESVTKKYGTKKAIDILVCDRVGIPLSPEKRARYKSDRDQRMEDFEREVKQTAGVATLSEEAQNIMNETLGEISDNVFKFWEPALRNDPESEYARYFHETLIGGFEAAKLAEPSANLRSLVEDYRPKISVKILSLCYLQISGVPHSYRIVGSDGNTLARFVLSINRYDESSSFVCGICGEKWKYPKESDYSMHMCYESGEVIDERCFPHKCSCGHLVHPGREHQKFYENHIGYALPAKGCPSCGEGKGYICSDHFHTCAEPGCTEIVCDFCVQSGLGAQQDGQYFCKTHKENYCAHCNRIATSHQMIECSCGGLYCVDCDPVPVKCDCCGKWLCGGDGCEIYFTGDTGSAVCGNCVDRCDDCGEVITKNTAVKCACCGSTFCEKCEREHRASAEDSNAPMYADLVLSHKKRESFSVYFGDTQALYFCASCMDTCVGDCALCKYKFCDVSEYPVLGIQKVDKRFPASEKIWATCACCGNKYPKVYFSKNYLQLCETCAVVRQQIDGLNPADQRSNAVKMKKTYKKHKNKINIFKRIFDFSRKSVGQEHSNTNQVTIGNRKMYVIDEDSKKVIRKNI